MTEDILTVIWKESKSLLRFNSNRGKSLLILLAPIALFGVIFPIQFQQEWLTSYWSLAVAVVTPMMLIATTIAESFAGERERHTLETLLASRLPDQAILLGKMLTSLLFGWGMTLLLLAVSLVVVNLLMWDGAFHGYQSSILWMDLGVSLLMAGMVTNLGILISLRSPTVQGAAQSIMGALFIPLLLVQAVVFLLPNFVDVEIVLEMMARLDVPAIVGIFSAVLLAAAAGLFFGAWVRFNRARLILS